MKKAQEIRKEIIQTQFRKHMLQAAEEVIIRRGFKAATMDEIAREAGFCKATLYKYFKNKGEILLAIILQYIEDMKNRILEIAASSDPPERPWTACMSWSSRSTCFCSTAWIRLAVL